MNEYHIFNYVYTDNLRQFFILGGKNANNLTVIYQHPDTPPQNVLHIRLKEWCSCGVVRIQIKSQDKVLQVCEWELYGGE